MARGLFVTGTDTGVGKTLVACALVRGLRARGLDIGAMKPIETGVGPAGPLDALALRDAAGGGDPLEDVCPLQLSLPAAPNVAAAHEQRRVDIALLEAAFARLSLRHAALIVEGAGGLLVPVDDESNMADLAWRLSLPLVVVARAALGTINHTRLTLAEVERRGHALAGVVISHSSGELSPADRANLAQLERELGDRLLGQIPPLRAGQPVPLDAIRLDSLLRFVGGG